MKKVLVPFFLLASVFTFSQKKRTLSGAGFCMISSAGVAIGEKSVNPVFQVVPGIYFKKFSAGIGLGFDDYRFRSMPLFADVRFKFGRRDFGFLYADAGYNFPFDIKKTESTFNTTDIYKGGFYGDAGIGFRIFTRSRHAFLFSTGYSIKDIKNKVGYTYNTFVPPAVEDIYHYRYSLGRIVSKLSWEFGGR